MAQKSPDFYQYKYFKGEWENLFKGHEDYDKSRFWDFEKNHFNNEYFNKLHLLV